MVYKISISLFETNFNLKIYLYICKDGCFRPKRWFIQKKIMNRLVHSMNGNNLLIFVLCLICPVSIPFLLVYVAYKTYKPIKFSSFIGYLIASFFLGSYASINAEIYHGTVLRLFTDLITLNPVSIIFWSFKIQGFQGKNTLKFNCFCNFISQLIKSICCISVWAYQDNLKLLFIIPWIYSTADCICNLIILILSFKKSNNNVEIDYEKLSLGLIEKSTSYFSPKVLNNEPVFVNTGNVIKLTKTVNLGPLQLFMQLRRYLPNSICREIFYLCRNDKNVFCTLSGLPEKLVNYVIREIDDNTQSYSEFEGKNIILYNNRIAFNQHLYSASNTEQILSLPLKCVGEKMTYGFQENMSLKEVEDVYKSNTKSILKHDFGLGWNENILTVMLFMKCCGVSVLPTISEIESENFEVESVFPEINKNITDTIKNQSNIQIVNSRTFIPLFRKCQNISRLKFQELKYDYYKIHIKNEDVKKTILRRFKKVDQNQIVTGPTKMTDSLFENEDIFNLIEKETQKEKGKTMNTLSSIKDEVIINLLEEDKTKIKTNLPEKNETMNIFGSINVKIQENSSFEVESSSLVNLPEKNETINIFGSINVKIQENSSFEVESSSLVNLPEENDINISNSMFEGKPLNIESVHQHGEMGSYQDAREPVYKKKLRGLIELISNLKEGKVVEEKKSESFKICCENELDKIDKKVDLIKAKNEMFKEKLNNESEDLNEIKDQQEELQNKNTDELTDKTEDKKECLQKNALILNDEVKAAIIQAKIAMEKAKIREQKKLERRARLEARKKEKIEENKSKKK